MYGSLGNVFFIVGVLRRNRRRRPLSGLKKADFVSEVQGKPTALYVLKNKQGAEACVTNWGGRLVSVMVPDKNGKLTDVVLGYGQYPAVCGESE